MAEPAPLDVVTFGETMIRLSPVDRGRIEQASALEIQVGGSESNTACALAQLGRRAAWWSRLPDSPPGRRVAGEIRRWGVDTEGVIWTTGRLGLYFVEFGAPPRPTEVHYDRAGSAASEIAPADVDEELLRRARHLHLTGITAALSDSCAAAVHHAAAQARRLGLTVSLDVNYRRKLWEPARARDTLSGIIPLTELLICAGADAEELFGCSGEAAAAARELQQRFQVRAVVVTAGAEGAAAVEEERELAAASCAAVEVDRIGAGDAFDAGLLDGFLDGDLERGLRFGCVMAALKHTIPGDILIATRAEVEAAMSASRSAIRR